MTAGRFEPHGEAAAHGQGESHERTESWEQSGTWAQAESWDYDEARAGPEAYDLLELRLMRDERAAPRFERFQAAVADTLPLMPEFEAPARGRWPTRASLLAAVRTGRFWASALWLAGAAGAGVVAGLVSTNLMALALHSEASSLVAAPALTSAAALPAPAPVLAAAPAQAAASEIAGGAIRMDPLATAITATPEQIRAAEAARAAQGGSLGIPTPPPPGALALAALIEATPARAGAADAGPGDRPPAGATVGAKAPAELAAGGPAPTPPPAAAEARATVPLAPAAAPAPSAEYRVQLALLRDQQNVKYVWQEFVARFGPSARNLHRYVFPTRTAHGTRHLVQVGPFADETHAEAVCSRLKERGGDCLVVRQPS